MIAITAKLLIFTDTERRIYAGRDLGSLEREYSYLNLLDKLPGTVGVPVHENVLSVNASYFLGLFGPSIASLGEKGFREKYLFSGRDISFTVDHCISEVLRLR